MANRDRAYSGGYFAFEIDGFDAGWLLGWEGGLAGADVVTEKIGPDLLQHKHLGTPKYEDISLFCGSSISKKFLDWINLSMNPGKDYIRHDGALVQADYNRKEILRLEFSQALISEITLPGCDANSKEPGKMVVKLAPEYTRILTSGAGRSIIAGSPSLGGASQKHWLSRNFSFKIYGLDIPHVVKVDALVLKQKTVEFAVGEFRDPLREPTSIEYPNISITVPEAYASDLFDWYDKFIVKGGAPESPGGVKDGLLTFYSENLTNVAGTVSFTGLGLFKLTQSKAEAHQDSIRTVKADMFMEKCLVNFPIAAG